MSKRNNVGSLTYQVQQRYQSMLATGRDRHQDKQNGVSHRYIYGWSTYRTYTKHANYFAQYCKEEHGCRTLEECRQYVPEWFATRKHLSAPTQKLEATALVKLYGSSYEQLEIRPDRAERHTITRSRLPAERDKHFSEKNHAELVEFCRSVGCRRSELQRLPGTAMQERDGKLYLHIKGKGGKWRWAPVTGDSELVRRICTAAGSGRVIEQMTRNGKVPEAMDTHSYRADYAARVYLQHARPLEDLQGVREHYGRYNRDGSKRLQPALYVMRGDRSGEMYDRKAMITTSKALGHNRESVVADHYLYSIYHS